MSLTAILYCVGSASIVFLTKIFNAFNIEHRTFILPPPFVNVNFLNHDTVIFPSTKYDIKPRCVLIIKHIPEMWPDRESFKYRGKKGGGELSEAPGVKFCYGYITICTIDTIFIHLKKGFIAISNWTKHCLIQSYEYEPFHLALCLYLSLLKDFH